METNKFDYSNSKGGSLADKAACNTRLKIYKKLSDEIDIENISKIIDVGVTADKSKMASNFFENIYPFSERLTAFSDQDASWMEEKYGGLKFVQGNALQMPFEDNSFDLVFSSAVIEHVGNIKNQEQFIRECYRVSKKYVFITTPNRYHPIELHTALPLIHWLPKKVHRKILSNIGMEYLSKEGNLNLLDKKDVTMLCKINGIEKYKLQYEYFLGFPSNILLLMEKDIEKTKNGT